MKDHFSIQSATYAQFRPHYPDEMIAYVVSWVQTKEAALDVATGNGQVAHKLSPYFDKVYATDISDSQLQKAVPAKNVVYKVASAEHTTFGSRQFDLITVAQAVHWFKFDEFYKEVYRILKPDGIFAVLGYGLFSTNPDSDCILMDYYHEIVGPYWDAERRYIDENYETIPFPFEEFEAPKFNNQFTWTFDQLIGYLQTWSATQQYKNKNGRNPVAQIHDQLQESWANSDQKVTFPLLLRIGKLKNEQK